MKVLTLKSSIDEQLAPNLAGQVYLAGQMLMGSSGDLIPATSAATEIDGISLEAIPTTDPRYAVASQISYHRVKEGDEIEMDITGAALSAAVPFTDYDLSDSQTVNLAATTTKVVKYLRPGQGGRGVFAIVRRSRATSA